MSRFRLNVTHPIRATVMITLVYWLILGTGLSVLSANLKVNWSEGSWQDAFIHAFVHGSWIGAVVGLMAAQLVLTGLAEYITGQVQMRNGFLGRIYLYLFGGVAYLLVWPVVKIMTLLGWLQRDETYHHEEYSSPMKDGED